MKEIKLIKKAFSVLFILFILVTPLMFLDAQIEYKPISVIPGVTEGAVTDIEVYLNAVFKFTIGIAAVLAVVQITLGGIEYMTSSATGSLQNAKDKIWDAIIGLLIILSVYIVLAQINPDILEFRLGPEEFREGTGSGS